MSIAILCGGVGCSTVRKSDTAALQGTWKGAEIEGRTKGACYLMISGNKVEFRGGDTNEWYKGTFTLREDLSPRQVAFLIRECPDTQYTGKTAHGIYRLEKGTLTFAANEPGNPEIPSRFDAPGARRFVLNKH